MSENKNAAQDVKQEKKSKADIISKYVASLIEDEQLAKSKYWEAQPAYYGIWTCEDMVVMDGYEEDHQFHLVDDWGSGMSAREAFEYCWENEMIFDSDLEYAFTCHDDITLEYLEKTKGALPDDIDDTEIKDFIVEHFNDEFDYLLITRVGKVAQNAMFLTDKEAHEHLESNAHHYSHDAHVFCMTAWRNPALYDFMKALKDIDFEKSNLVFKEDNEQL